MFRSSCAEVMFYKIRLFHSLIWFETSLYYVTCSCPWARYEPFISKVGNTWDEEVRFRPRPDYNRVKSLAMGGWVDASPPYRKLKRFPPPEYWGFICQLSFPKYSILIFIVIPFLSEGQAGEVCRLSNTEILVQMSGIIRLKSNLPLFQASYGYNEHRCVVRAAVLTDAGSHSSHTTPNSIFPSCIYFFLFPVELRSGLPLRDFAMTLMGHATLGRTPLDEWSARRRDFFLTMHNTHKRQTSIHPVEFEPVIPASERPQTHALDRATTGIGACIYIYRKKKDNYLLPKTSFTFTFNNT